MATTSVFLPGKSHGQRSLAGYSQWGHKELETTEQLHTYTHMHTHTLRHVLNWSLRIKYTHTHNTLHVTYWTLFFL